MLLTCCLRCPNNTDQLPPLSECYSPVVSLVRMLLTSCLPSQNVIWCILFSRSLEAVPRGASRRILRSAATLPWWRYRKPEGSSREAPRGTASSDRLKRMHQVTFWEGRQLVSKIRTRETTGQYYLDNGDNRLVTFWLLDSEILTREITG